MKQLFKFPLLVLTASSVAVATQDFQHARGMISANSLFARQNCGVGATCEEACGAGYIICDHDPYCYNPTAGDTCCGSSGHYCPAGQFCAPVQGYCCENGQDPASCAVEQGFTLPASSATQAALTTTAAPVTSAPAPAITTVAPTTTVAAATTTTFAGPATFTGGAMKVDVGWVGQALAMAVGMVGLA